MKGLKLLGGSFCHEFISVLPQICYTFPICKERQLSWEVHGDASTAAGAHPFLAEREGPECYSVRTSCR